MHQTPWSFGLDSQTRGTRENRSPPCVKERKDIIIITGFLTGPRPRLVVSRSTCPPLFPPPTVPRHYAMLGWGARHTRIIIICGCVCLRVCRCTGVCGCTYAGTLSCLLICCLLQVGDVCDRRAVAFTWMPLRVQMHMRRHEEGRALGLELVGVVGCRKGDRSTVLAAVFIRMLNWCRTAQGYIRMYVRTTRQVRVESEILVMYQSDRGFFWGVQGRCRCCLCEKCTPECCA